MAGGQLTGRYQAGQALQEGTRIALEIAGQLYHARYCQEAQMRAVDQLKRLCNERDKELAEC